MSREGALAYLREEYSQAAMDKDPQWRDDYLRALMEPK